MIIHPVKSHQLFSWTRLCIQMPWKASCQQSALRGAEITTKFDKCHLSQSLKSVMPYDKPPVACSESINRDARLI